MDSGKRAVLAPFWLFSFGGKRGEDQLDVRKSRAVLTLQSDWNLFPVARPEGCILENFFSHACYYAVLM